MSLVPLVASRRPTLVASTRSRATTSVRGCRTSLARRACRVAYYHDGSIDDPAEALASYRAWAIENMLKLSKVLGARLPTG